MPSPTVSPTTANAPPYTISDSTAFIAVFTANIQAAGEEGINLSYPDGLAGLTLSLIHIDRTTTPPTRSTPVPLPAGGNVPPYTISTILSPPAGGNVQLAVNIFDNGGGTVTGEAWELRASADVRATWILSVSSGQVNVNWLAVDPVAALTVPATTLEQQTFSLNASNARSPGTVAGPLPASLTPTYTWKYTGDLPLTELSTNTTTTNPFISITPPGVYEPVPLQFTVTTTFSDAAGIYTGFLQNTSDPAPTTVTQRPQLIVIVLDRSGSMVHENRYENAKIACRVLVHLFDGLRKDLNPADRVAIVAFEDEVVGFRGGAPSSRIQTLLPLSKLPDAVTQIDNPAFDFGAPGTNTPIGDGLIFAIDLLGNAGPIENQRFTIILLTDGQENSGTVALVPASAVNGAISFQQAVSQSQTRRAVLDQSRCKLSAIALGPTADQNVLNRLAAFNAGEFQLVSDPSELAGSFGHMLENSQAVNAPIKDTSPPAEAKDQDAFPSGNAVYFSTEATADRLALSVVPPAGTTVMTDTIQLAIFDGGSYVPQPVTILATASDRATLVPKLPAIAAGKPIFWRVIHGAGPASAHPLAVGQVLAFVDLHLRADVLLDQPAYRTGDRMTLTVRIRQDASPILGATVTAALDAPSVGLGQELFALGSKPAAPVETSGRDVPTWLERLIFSLLAQHRWQMLPRTQRTGIFVDGTDQLFDPDGDGNYTNTFARVFKEGTYAWRLSVDGQDVTVNPFTRALAISTFASVKVDPKATTVNVTRIPGHPSKMDAAQVVITPQDKRGEHLGPGQDHEVVWALKGGIFEYVFDHKPPPVSTDGTYQRAVLFTREQRPVLLVRAADVLLREIDIRKQLLGPYESD